jgi:hypothetical protein
MSLRVSPGPDATPHDVLVAEAQLRVLSDELLRIRATALAWRNGLAALLAGLIGFGLIKGKSDVGQLASPWGAVVGILLGLSLIAGAIGAALLLRAAHGPPWAISAQSVVDDAVEDPEGEADRVEALDSAQALGRGVALVYLCAAFLVAAVGVSWYGPAQDSASLLVVTHDGDRCGTVVRLANGVLTLKTSSGQIGISMTQATGISAVDRCPAASTAPTGA